MPCKAGSGSVGVKDLYIELVSGFGERSPKYFPGVTSEDPWGFEAKMKSTAIALG